MAIPSRMSLSVTFVQNGQNTSLIRHVTEQECQEFHPAEGRILVIPGRESDKSGAKWDSKCVGTGASRKVVILAKVVILVVILLARVTNSQESRNRTSSATIPF